jgi:hypothetical protein
MARDLFKAPEGGLALPWKIPENLLVHMWKKLGRYFPIFDNKPKNLQRYLDELWSWKKRNHYTYVYKKNFVQPCQIKEWIIFLFPPK